VQATSWITEIGTTLSKRSSLMIYSYTLMIVVTSSGIWLLAPIYGLLGVGLAVLTGHIAKALLASWLAQRSYRMPWDYGRAAAVFVTTLIVGLLATYSGNTFHAIAEKLILLSGIFLILGAGWCFILAYEDRVVLKNILSSLLQKERKA